jgi:hypothetical protein
VGREEDLKERLQCAINWLNEIARGETDVHDDKQDMKRLRRHIREIETTLEDSGDHAINYVHLTLDRIQRSNGKEVSMMEVSKSLNITEALRRETLPEVDYCSMDPSELCAQYVEV